MNEHRILAAILTVAVKLNHPSSVPNAKEDNDKVMQSYRSFLKLLETEHPDLAKR